MTRMRSRLISPFSISVLRSCTTDDDEAKLKDSYLPNGRLTQQYELDIAARLRRRSGRVCHSCRRCMQVNEWQGVVAVFCSTRQRSVRG